MAYTTINDPTQYFNTVLYTGTGSSTSITGVGFQPDLVYTTSRSNSYNNGMFDSSRGANKLLNSNTNNAEASIGNGISSFDSDGFSFSGDAYNTSAYTFVAWNWLANGGTTSSNTDGSITSTVQANTTAGFSIVTFTGTGANGTFGHGLGAVPKFIIFNNRTDTSNWICYHEALGNTTGVYLNLTNANSGTSSAFFNNTTPTSSVVSIGVMNEGNGSGDDIVAYCFSEIKGYSKFGSYTGNGSSDGPFIYTGFKPAFIISKGLFTKDWTMVDNKRNTYNVVTKELFPNQTYAETTNDRLDFVSNGFKVTSSGAQWNNSGSTYIYMAFAESPFVSSDGVPTTAR